MPETKKFNKRVFVWGLLFVALLAAVSISYFKKEEPGVDFVEAKRSDIVQEVSVTGSVKAMDRVNLGFEIAGKVAWVNVKVGDKIAAGDALAGLDSTDIKAKLLHARANLTEAQALLSELKAGTRKEEIDIQKTKVENAKTALDNAKKDVINKLQDAYSRADDAIRNKADQLFNNPASANPELNVVISNNQLESNVEFGRLEIGQVLEAWQSDLYGLTQQSNLLPLVERTDKRLSQARGFLDNVALVVNSLVSSASLSQTTIDGYKTDIWSARSSINTAIINLSAAKEKLTTALSALSVAQKELVLKEAGATAEQLAAQEARVLSAKANVEDVSADLAKTVIRSPISGIATKVDMEVGEMISPNSALISVMSDKGFKIEANIAEADIAKISVGDSAKVTLDAYGDGVVWDAIVKEIDPAETVIEGVPTYKTTFTLLPDGEKVKPGMTANIDILTNKKTGVIAIPARAVKTVDGKKTVKVLSGSGAIIEKSVETGLRGSDGKIEVLSGIDEGEKVVVFMR